MTTHDSETPPRPRMKVLEPRNLGAVFTKRWIVDMILDLVGYTSENDLGTDTIIEPSAGHGAFVISIVERLLDSCRTHGREIRELSEAIRAYDIDPIAVSACRSTVTHLLVDAGVDHRHSARLARTWIREADFLRAETKPPLARWVVGNPPYVRLEDVDPEATADYRRLWTTMSGRADLYVGFIEAALSRLVPEGGLGFICADRWMRNKYGSALRRLIEERYAMDACIVLHDVDAFEDSVAAYPAITVMRAGRQGQALVCEAGATFGARASERVQEIWQRGPARVTQDPDFRVSWTTGWFNGQESWPSAPPDRLARLAALEARLPTLEESGAKVAVGAATGADKIYVRTQPPVESERMIPAVSAKELSSGKIVWSQRYLVNPWEADGLADLDAYPRLKRYFNRNKKILLGRYVARKNPTTWWRTIDRIDAAAARRPKLLIPDLKDRIYPVLDRGEFFPLHSLYYVTSDIWDLEVLGGLLMSTTANAFVEAYSVRMASGYMRVSAQYLRRVRVPRPQDLDPTTSSRLAAAFRARDFAAASAAAAQAYALG